MADWTRRQFLDASVKGVAAVSLPTVFRLDPAAAFASPLTKGGTLQDYLTHFTVDESIIRRTMALALERGGDYCDIFFQHVISNNVNLEDDMVSRASSQVDFGVGIRVCAGEQTGYSFSEEITPEALQLAAQTAANIATSGTGSPPHAFSANRIADYYPVETRWEETSIGDKIPILLKVNEMMTSREPRIIKTTVRLADSNSYVMIATSDGRISCDYQPMLRIFANCTAVDNDRREKGGYNLSGRVGIEYLTEERLENLVATAVERTVRQFRAVSPDAGAMEVVLAPGSSGILLHEAIGHGMEADFNRKGTSIFADKIGKAVAKPFVNIVDDGTNPGLRGSINMDDEGNPVECTYMVRNGILESYLHDRMSARHYKVKPTGNGRRQSFRHMPMPRMRNTYMLAGPHDPEEIIKTVKRGIYAESFANGEVAIGAGDFSFYVRTGYEIENGKLGRPLKEVNLIGNGPDVLSKIVMVGDDMQLMEGGGTCGKNGQWVPVSFGLPTIKVAEITVGGVNRNTNRRGRRAGR
ncbi:MAG: TldD/PmbA family protein [bacterium]|nr:TldD/PmbA family protein [bacterium]